MREVKLYISVPSCREWKPAFGSSFAALTFHLVKNGVRGCNLTRFMPEIAAQASCLSRARQKALNNAINGGFTHWLSLDDDMQFPADVVERLISHDKDVVTCNYRRKDEVISGVCTGLDGIRLNSIGKHDLEQIGWMGGGLFLADLEKIKHVPKPHFEVSWCEKAQDYYDQDTYFSAKLRANGCEIWCDHGLSQEVIHIGDHSFAWPQKLRLAEAAE